MLGTDLCHFTGSQRFFTVNQRMESQQMLGDMQRIVQRIVQSLTCYKLLSIATLYLNSTWICFTLYSFTDVMNDGNSNNVWHCLEYCLCLLCTFFFLCPPPWPGFSWPAEAMGSCWSCLYRDSIQDNHPNKFKVPILTCTICSVFFTRIDFSAESLIWLFLCQFVSSS